MVVAFRVEVGEGREGGGDDSSHMKGILLSDCLFFFISILLVFFEFSACAYIDEKSIDLSS